jgi:hypothetical protein
MEHLEFLSACAYIFMALCFLKHATLLLLLLLLLVVVVVVVVVVGAAGSV